MNFQQFRETRQFSENLDQFGGDVAPDIESPGLVYDGCMYIQILRGQTDQYGLVIERSEYWSSNLIELERRLFDFACRYVDPTSTATRLMGGRMG